MFYTIKLKNPVGFPATVFFALSLLLVVLLAANLKGGAAVSAPAEAPCLVIDPGHGGVDGGAVSIGGARESDINLAIALRMRELAEFYGVRAVMTRESDAGALDTGKGSYSEHQELVKRTEIANSVPGAVLISIHQNFYPTAQPSGAQVLYAPGEESKALGLLAHNNLVSCLDPANRRVAAPAKNLYMTDHAQCPAILVECGFMSNFAELEKLQSGSYQSSLAAVLTASYLQYAAGRQLT